MKRGFSLLEVVIVLVILGLLLVLGISNFLRWRAQAELEEAARSLAQAFQYARAEAKRTNSSRCVKVWPEGWASGQDCGTLSNPTRRFQGAQVSASNYTLPASVQFNPPHGTTDAPLKKFTLQHSRYPSLQRNVNVIGVIGKAVVR
ncbi:GspH/FimT family pseudopilin [Thermus igniterrae]|uniref:GspH/FimT family pseudopilin n=1 Tax=Thermus igniterrae TaxID=88189 RepID=UPI00036D765B|nr:GspH/FimT family pseudopilin [Thermus igniterrae]